MSHSINKDICASFPQQENSGKEHNEEHLHGTIHCKPKEDTHSGSIGYFLYNNDYTNVMQELNASVSNFTQKRENVLHSVSLSPPVALLSLAPDCSNKNGLLATAPSSNNVPKTDDSDVNINLYLDNAFPKYVTSNNSEGTSEPCSSPFAKYEIFPTFSTSYCNINKKVVNYKSTRPDWEPYDWFFAQISWSQSDSDHTYTFCELAIAAHILTGGATSPSQDLCTKTNCMNLAFKRYFQKQKIGGKNYKEFFQPSNKVKTLSSIGCDNLLGIRRMPFFNASPDILNEVRLIAWKAVQHWETTARIAKFGEDFLPKSKIKSSWTPDSVLWLYTTMEQRKQEKLASSIASISTPAVSISSPILISPSGAGSRSLPPDSNKNAHLGTAHTSARNVAIKCFYGHKVSSATDWNGREQWRYSPTPPWPSVPPARPLCQKWYRFHRSEYLKGNSQYHFLQLYVNRPPEVGGASSSCSARPPGL